MGLRVPRVTALEIWGLCRQWHLPATQVILKLLAPSLADHARMAEIGRQQQLFDDTREALAELQERVAEKDSLNLELQRALEKAQAQLREAGPLVGEKAGKKTEVPKDVATLVRAVVLHEQARGLAEQEASGRIITNAAPLLIGLRIKLGSWAAVEKAGRDASATMGVAW